VTVILKPTADSNINVELYAFYGQAARYAYFKGCSTSTASLRERWRTGTSTCTPPALRAAQHGQESGSSNLARQSAADDGGGHAEVRFAQGGLPQQIRCRRYESVLQTMGKNQEDWMRLFMVPGMAHCGGGPGPNTFDTIGAMEYWRERGVATAQMTAANAQTAMTRPLCPYPQYAKYNGSGNVKDAANWVCAAR
jgi:Tannase and feruloyl esterase